MCNSHDILYIYSHPLFCDVPPTNIHTKNHQQQQQTQAGGVAGLVVDIVLFPIDTVKTRLQSERGFWKSGGFRGVYNGLAPAAVGSVPSAALFFCTYESVKRLLLDHTRPEYAPLVHMTSASLAETVACFVRVPVEIVKQRRQTNISQSGRLGGVQVLWQAYRTEGLCRGIYRGFGSTLLREIPFSLIQFPIWEYLKASWPEATGTELTAGAVAACGAVAGGVAAALTTPLDVAKTRIMLAERFEGRRHTVPRVLQAIYAERGLRGVFAGFVPRVLWITLGGAIFFGTYDLVTQQLQQHNQIAAQSSG